MSKYDVVIKNVEEVKTASVRDVVPTPPEQGGLWGELEGYLAMQRVRPTGACFTLYHDDEFKERDWDLEVCEPIDGGCERVTAREGAHASRVDPGLHHPQRAFHHHRRSLQRHRQMDHG